jgi:hypothetical protein
MKIQAYLQIAVVASGVLAQEPRLKSGFVGYGIDAFNPFCAFACHDSISGATLSCSTTTSDGTDGMDGMEGMGGMVMTDPECYATDDAFLQTLAWCVKSHCKDIPVWKLERYWKDNVVGSNAVQPDPKETYQQALAKVETTPTVVYNGTGSLNEVSVVAEDTWFVAFNTDTIFIHQETQQEGYG